MGVVVLRLEKGSFTSQNTVLCFNAFYDPSDAGDCLLLPPSSDASLSIVQQDTSRGSEISNSLPNFNAGVVYEPDTVVSFETATCTIRTCNKTAVLVTTTCRPMETCDGNGVSMLKPICTVTGSSVIDFKGHVDFIKDQCEYSLLKLPSILGFQVLGNFLERRRKDVSFLDSVMLIVDGSRIHLKQGSRVLLNNSPLNLDSSPQVVHGVEISKDQTGVTAKAVFFNFLNVSIFFDSYTTQIHLEGSTGSPPTGLCEDSSSEARLPGCSSISCETQYNDTDDRSINCTKTTECCNLLKEVPFTSCDIDPEPYITACTDTLSRYPAVDGLKCQFLEAYARACSLKSNTTLEGWRSKTECSPKAFCQDRTCSDHEFCGEVSQYGDTRCFCRANFACRYRNTLGDPAICSHNTASASLAICLLENEGIDYSLLHLNDPTCRGQVDEQNHTVTFSFSASDLCGTKITTNNNQVIYQNTIMTQNFSSDDIIRHDQVMIDFSCYHAKSEIRDMSFRIKDNSVYQVISSGPWNYNVSMRAYINEGCTQAVESTTKVRLNEKVWMKLDTKGLDENLVALVTDSCWATDQPSASASLKYYLIIDGCPNPTDPTVRVERNGVGTSSGFSFNMFEFTGGSDEIYLHCKLHLCVKQGNSCIPVVSMVTGLIDRLLTSMMIPDC
ncbi:alpha-tectorin-like [Nematolebias whitei]|uniref:alpha-tectorin-like n=1 Tax=Nematolebias whitei TaxID=451745 RepID=UPI00189B6903|nr:alpha-tectorin-like [Nematolebias whitei]